MPTYIETVAVVTSGENITVPSSTKGVIVSITHVSGEVSVLSSISLGGAGSFTIAQNVSASGSRFGQALAWAETTAIGSRTLSFAFDEALAFEPAVLVVFVDDITAGDWIRNTDADSVGSGTVSSVVTSQTSDLVIAFNSLLAVNPDTQSGYTSQASGITPDTSTGWRVSIANSPNAGTTTFDSPNSGIVATSLISLKSAGGSTVTWVQSRKPRNFRAHMAQ